MLEIKREPFQVVHKDIQRAVKLDEYSLDTVISTY